MIVIYEALCPGCGGDVDSHRLGMGLPCSSCLPEAPESLFRILDPVERARRIQGLARRPLEGLRAFTLLWDELESFSEFFRGAAGSPMWPLQRSWALRLLSGASFALTAPTGTGKSTLVQAYSIYTAQRGSRVFFIVPTRELLRQSVSRLAEMARRAGSDLEIAWYDSSSSPRARAESLGKIEAGEYRILVTTSSFLARVHQLVRGSRPWLVVADDLDALLKSSRNMERILEILGISREEIEMGREIAVKKAELGFAKASGDSERVSQLVEEIEVLRARLLSSLLSRRTGQLVVSTATGKSWGLRSKILREVLGFEVGGVLEYLRNVVDLYAAGGVEKLPEILEKLGPGVLILSSRGFPSPLEDVLEAVSRRGLRAAIYRGGGSALKKFLGGEIDYLIGKASFYGPLVRGLDEPLRIRAVVFLGVPKHVIPVRSFLSDLRSLALAFRACDVCEQRYREIVSRIKSLSPSSLGIVRKALRGEAEARGGLAELVEISRRWVEEALEILGRACARGPVRIGGSLILCSPGGDPVATVPDAMTYIQASGRSSRLYMGSMTLGLSLVFPESPELLSLLAERLRRYVPEISFSRLEDADLEDLVKRLDESRKGRGASAGLGFKSALLLVESPAKARTLASLFGSRSKRVVGPVQMSEFSVRVDDTVYMITAVPTMGHIFDLSTREGIYGILLDRGVPRPRYGFIRRCLSCGSQHTDPVEKCPRCGGSRFRSSEDLVMVLRKIAGEFDEVLVATDPDIEGEKIAWDLALSLSPYAKRILRVELHEITRRGLLEALRSSRKISQSLVDAQIVRRLDDRLVGFSVSQELQKVFSMRWLGAGRVETPALSWICERYEEYRSSSGFWVSVSTGGLRVRFFYRSREDAEKAAEEALEKGVEVAAVERAVRILSPPPPFTTDTLIFEASARLGLSAGQAMRTAQELFEMGLITYHRTDSTRVSSKGVEIAGEYMRSKGLESLFHPRLWGEEGAHEAIRPTMPVDAEDLEKTYLEGSLSWARLSRAHEKLYDLIFRRFIASQSKPCRAELCSARLRLAGSEARVEGICSDSEEEGFNRIYRLLRKIVLGREGSRVPAQEVRIYRGSLARLMTSGELVRLMRERGVGRPSTYAKAVENNKRHGYVVESKRGFLVPTKLGLSVLEHVKRTHPELTSEKHTRDLMAEVERVEKGLESGEEIARRIFNSIVEQRLAEQSSASFNIHSGATLTSPDTH